MGSLQVGPRQPDGTGTAEIALLRCHIGNLHHRGPRCEALQTVSLQLQTLAVRRAQANRLISSVRFINPLTLRPAPSSLPMPTNDATPEGYVKSILPCTPLAIIKILEHTGVYNKMLQYGDRARGKVITVINRYV